MINKKTENQEAPVCQHNQPESYEEVEISLQRIALQNKAASIKKQGVNKYLLLALKILFFPFTLLAIGIKRLTLKLRMRITVKTTITFTLVFATLIVIYAVFINISVSNQLQNGNTEIEPFLKNLQITSVILIILFIIVGAVVGGFVSQNMLSPVRNMSRQIEKISSDNLSARLDPLESQDELMELTGQINQMLDSLELSFTRQAHFVSDASHELKTPLSVIMGYSNLLMCCGKKDKEILQEAVEAIAHESANMKKIVEQLLWLAKLGKFTLTKRELNLNEALFEIVQSYNIIEQGHKISYRGAADIIINSDLPLLTEAIRTLVDNAIKYTSAKNGIITVSCKQSGDFAKIRVSDNGIGISNQDLPHIFDRFYRCDKSRGRESASSGLGLTIAKSIIEMMNGTIEVESTLGKGSVFTIKLPLNDTVQ